MHEQAQQQLLQRMQQLVAQSQQTSDPALAGALHELLQMVLQLHANGLQRLLQLLRGIPQGEALIQRLADDPALGGLLLLHDLHPLGLVDRVRLAIERLHPHLGVLGMRIVAFDLSGARLRLELAGDAGNTPMPDAQTLRATIEDALYTLAPDLSTIDIAGLPVAQVNIPLQTLRDAIAGQRRHGPAAAGSEA